jgi:hypothetical protein
MSRDALTERIIANKTVSLNKAVRVYVGINSSSKCSGYIIGFYVDGC